MTKKELVEVVAEKNGVSKKQATEMVNSVLETVCETLVKGENVDLTGFGKFEVKTTKARTGINPRTKEAVEIAESKAVRFKASKTLKTAVK